MGTTTVIGGLQCTSSLMNCAHVKSYHWLRVVRSTHRHALFPLFSIKDGSQWRLLLSILSDTSIQTLCDPTNDFWWLTSIGNRSHVKSSRDKKMVLHQLSQLALTNVGGIPIEDANLVNNEHFGSKWDILAVTHYPEKNWNVNELLKRPLSCCLHLGPVPCIK